MDPIIMMFSNCVMNIQVIYILISMQVREFSLSPYTCVFMMSNDRVTTDIAIFNKLKWRETKLLIIK